MHRRVSAVFDGTPYVFVKYERDFHGVYKDRIDGRAANRGASCVGSNRSKKQSLGDVEGGCRSRLPNSNVGRSPCRRQHSTRVAQGKRKRRRYDSWSTEHLGVFEV